MGSPARHSGGDRTSAGGSLNAGFGCTVLFLLPFCAVGVGTAAGAIWFALHGQWSEAGFFSIFALTFGGAGFGLLAAAVRGRRAQARQAAVEARQPEEPWMWREDWAAGRIQDASRGGMAMAWIFALFWNLISIPAAVLAVPQGMQQGKRAALVVLLFPLVGVGLLAWAVHTTLRYFRFGASTLELSTLPGVIGRHIAGTVQTTTGLPAGQPCRVELTCVHRVTTGSGRNRSTSEHILWQEEQEANASPAPHGVALAFDIPIAALVQPSGGTAGDRVLWRLRAHASMPGVDYDAVFEVPVFRTAESATPVPAPADPTETALEYHQPPGSSIRVTENRRGTSIVFPAGRNAGAAASVSGFILLWLGIVWGIVKLGAPLLFPLVFGGFGLLLLAISLGLWLGTTTLEIDHGQLAVTSGWLGGGRRRTYTAEEIDSITPRIGMQAGSRVFYDLRIRLRSGRTVSAGRGIRDKHEAEWLAERIDAALRVRATL